MAFGADHKRVFDHDKGPNTHGMGAYSSAQPLPSGEASRYSDLTAMSILQTMKQQGHLFVGVLHAGLMLPQTYTTRTSTPPSASRS